MIDVTKENFSTETKDGFCVLKFGAPWCAPCKAMAPIYEQLEKETPNVKFLTVNVEEEGWLASSYAISSLPSFIMMLNGSPLCTTIGSKKKEDLSAFINKAMNEAW